MPLKTTKFNMLLNEINDSLVSHFDKREYFRITEHSRYIPGIRVLNEYTLATISK